MFQSDMNNLIFKLNKNRVTSDILIKIMDK